MSAREARRDDVSLGSEEALVDALGSVTELRPRTVVIQGSGQGGVSDRIEESGGTPLEDLPGIPGAGVSGHAGTLIAGILDGEPIWVQEGRVHVYEGHGLGAPVAILRALERLGVESAILTYSVGGIRTDLEPGSLVVLDDLLNLSGRNPLRGPVRPGEVRFPDMSRPFDRAWAERVRKEGLARGVSVSSGVYASVLGPSYETRAEIRMIRRMGGDVVGMSAAAEVIACAARGIRVLGLALVTNRAAGLGANRLEHETVVEEATRRSRSMATLVRAALALRD